MMQQVAASHSEVAALPFSASSTAKAVEAGLEAEKSVHNSQAFEALYRDAKSPASYSNSHKDIARQSQAVDTASSSVAGKRDSSTDVNTDLPDAHTDAIDSPQTATLVEGERDTLSEVHVDSRSSHTDSLVDDANDEARLKDEKRDSTTDVNTDLPLPPTDGNRDASSQQVSIDSSNTLLFSGDLHPNATDDGSREGIIPPTFDAYDQPSQQAAKDEVYGVDENGNKLAEPIYTSMPIEEEFTSEEDALTSPQIGNTANQTDTSWVDFIDAVRKTNGNTTLEKPGQSAEFRHDNETEALTALASSKNNSPENTDADTLISQFAGEAVGADSLSGDEAVKIAEQLLAQLSTEENSTLSEDVISSLRAFTEAVGKMSDNTEALPNSGALNNEDALSLDALLAQFSTSNLNSTAELSHPNDLAVGSKLDNSENIDVGNEEAQGQSLSEDEQLILSLLNDALNEAAQLVSDEQNSGVIASANAQGVTNSTEPTVAGQTSSASDIFAGESKDEFGGLLLDSLATLSPQSAQKATEALAERVVSSLPAASNANQQEAVKSNIIAGINEYQQQVAQGREPGIDLSTIVEQAVLDAGISSAQAQQLSASVDAQAGQFLQLIHNTQSAAQNALATQFLTVDSHITETQQIRSEASKSQQQFEGFDKAVNIHKPEGQQQLNEKIRWMVNARNTMAEIRLDPPELGSMQVRVNVAGDAASVSFVVQSQHAKEALADAMPKLREMLNEQGIELGDAQVRKDNSSQSGNQNGQQLAGSNSGVGDTDGIASDEGRIIEQAVSREAKGGIDYYA